MGRAAAGRWRPIVAVGVPTLLVGLHATRYGQWIVDDAGLTFSYARSLATGAGAVLQPGDEPVEGFSNPTWLGLLVVGRWLRLFDRGTWFGVPDLVLFPKALALACSVGTFAAFHAVARAVTPRPGRVTLLAGAITAAIPSYVVWTTSGLENALFALVVVGLAAVLARAAVDDRLHADRTAVVCGLLAALAALTRPDGLVYLLAFPIVLVVDAGGRPGRPAVRPALVSLGTAAVPLGAYLAWRLATFGRWLPNTAAAKEQDLPGLTDLNRPAELLEAAGWTAGVLLVVMVVLVLVLPRPSPTATAVRCLLVPLGLALVAYAVLPGDWMALHRFSTPVWPLAALLLVLAVAEVVEAQTARARLATAGAVGVVALLALGGWWRQSDDFRTNATVGVCYIARNTGFTFNSYADRLGLDEASLLAVDGGGTSLTTRLDFVDLSGLTDHDIAGFWQRDDMEGLRDHVFADIRPTFIRVWRGWDGFDRVRLFEDPRLLADYEPVWAPAEGGGNWVRRDAVEDPATLARLRADAPDLAAFVDAPFFEDGLHWWCGPTLRPSAPGSDPVLTLEQAAGG